MDFDDPNTIHIDGEKYDETLCGRLEINSKMELKDGNGLATCDVCIEIEAKL